MDALSSAIENLNINVVPQVQISEPIFLGAFKVPERLFYEEKEIVLSYEIEQVYRTFSLSFLLFKRIQTLRIIIFLEIMMCLLIELIEI